MGNLTPEKIEREAIRFDGKVYAAESLDHADVARAMRCGLAVPA